MGTLTLSTDDVVLWPKSRAGGIVLAFYCADGVHFVLRKLFPVAGSNILLWLHSYTFCVAALLDQTFFFSPAVRPLMWFVSFYRGCYIHDVCFASDGCTAIYPGIAASLWQRLARWSSVSLQAG